VQLQISTGQDAVDFSIWVFEQAEEYELNIDWGNSGPMLKYEDAETGEFFTLGQLHKNGELSAMHRLPAQNGVCIIQTGSGEPQFNKTSSDLPADTKSQPATVKPGPSKKIS